MFSGGQTSQVGKEKITPEQLKILEEMAALGDEMSKSIKCEPVGQPEEGEEAADPSMVGSSCVASAEQYEAHKDTMFKDAQCNPLPGEEAYSCFIPESNKATENSAKRFKDSEAVEPVEKSGAQRLYDAGMNVIREVPIIGGLWAAELEFAGVVLDLMFGDEEVEEAEEAEETGSAESGKDTGDAGKAKKADEKGAKESWEGELIIDVDGTKDIEYISDKTDVKYQLKEESEQYGAKGTKESIRKDMVKFAIETAQNIAGRGERVIWDIGAFEYAYNTYANMVLNGMTIDQYPKGYFKNVGWAMVSYAGDREKEWVNVLTGEKKPIKKVAPAG